MRLSESKAYLATIQQRLLWFRALNADYNRLHVSEGMYSWHSITADQLRDILRYFFRMISPIYFEQTDLKSALLQAQMRLSSELHFLRIGNEIPMSERKIHRRKAMRGLFA